MRGNPVRRLRRSMARALRRAIAGSVLLAILSIALAVGAVTMLEQSEAGSLDGATSNLAEGARGFAAITPDRLTDAPAPPPRAAVAEPALSSTTEGPTAVEEQAPDSGVRRSATAAIESEAAPPLLPLSIEERHAALVDRAIARADEPEVVEPPVLAPLDESESTPSILAASPVDAPTPALVAGDLIEATISFYYCEQGDTDDGGDGGGFCGAMRDGTIVYEGAAACAYAYLGQQFRIVGDPTERLYTCHDTGSAVHGLHRDIFFHQAADGWPWLAAVGSVATLEIVR